MAFRSSALISSQRFSTSSPVSADLIREHMRMPPDQLLIDRIERIADVEPLLLRRHLREENRLQDEIAELRTQIVPVAPLDRIEHLIGFLKRVRLDRFERLLAIPRTSARSPQPRHDLNQPLKLRACSARCEGRVFVHFE